MEFEAIRSQFPEILNGLPTDNFYIGNEPDRNQEILQTWQALKEISTMNNQNEIEGNQEHLLNLIESARSLYTQANQIISLTDKSGNEHLDALEQGIIKFRRLAQV